MTHNPPQWQPPKPKYVGWYILKYRKPIPCSDRKKIGLIFKKGRKRVRGTYIGKYWVSTVFLGLDHGNDPNEPLLFETMVFNDDSEEYFQEIECYRTTTWRKALKQHWLAVEEIKEHESKV